VEQNRAGLAGDRLLGGGAAASSKRP